MGRKYKGEFTIDSFIYRQERLYHLISRSSGKDTLSRLK
jgi:hypothetical protein